MTDFRFAAKALWNTTYKNTFYTRLIGDETVEDALRIVYEQAGKTNKDTELVRRIEHLQGRTFIYASHDDNITPAAAWMQVKREGFQLKTYPQMNHPEMVALFRQDLLQDVTADLLGRTITSADTDIVGILCDANDAECVNRLPAEDE